MDALLDASRSGPIPALISDFYYHADVTAIALGIHGKFVSLFHSYVDPRASIEDILRAKKIPPGWDEVCKQSGFPKPMAPVYVAIYVKALADEAKKFLNVPSAVGDVVVVVERAGPFIASADRGRYRPIQGGISVGSAYRANSGTLGGFCRNLNSGERLLLTCNHVVNAGTLGSHVLQQAKDDGGSAPKDTVARIAHLVPLQSPTGFSYADPYNAVDAALASVDPTVAHLALIRLLGPVASSLSRSQISMGDDVIFVGKESDYQEARVGNLVARAKIRIDNTDYNFGDLFEIVPRFPMYFGQLSKGGDSGAWIVREEGSRKQDLCGVLYAGDGSRGLCGFAETVFSEFNRRFSLRVGI